MYSLGQAEFGISVNLKDLVSGIGTAKGIVLGLGGTFAAMGAEAVNMAGTYQSQITQLVTGAGEAQKNLGMISQGILDMSVNTATSTTELTSGMFTIESAGYRGKAGLDALRAAAEGAKVGAASLADVAGGETTIMTDFSKQHITAAMAVIQIHPNSSGGR